MWNVAAELADDADDDADADDGVGVGVGDDCRLCTLPALRLRTSTQPNSAVSRLSSFRLRSPLSLLHYATTRPLEFTLTHGNTNTNSNSLSKLPNQCRRKLSTVQRTPEGESFSSRN